MTKAQSIPSTMMIDLISFTCASLVDIGTTKRVQSLAGIEATHELVFRRGCTPYDIADDGLVGGARPAAFSCIKDTLASIRVRMEGMLSLG